jgi:RNA polymerase sigma factor (sigma-70 family)
MRPSIPTVTVDDLIQVGRLALVGVARRYDPAKGVPFGGYLQRRLRGAMQDLLEVEHSRFFSAPRDGDWDPTKPRRVHLSGETSELGGPDGLQHDVRRRLIIDTDLVIDRCTPDPEASTEAEEISRVLARVAREVLSDRELVVLDCLFVKGMTLLATGKAVGLGESRTCQVRTEILAKLATRLKSLGITSLPAVFA